MAIHKTAQGRTIDMAALIAKNEKTRAVGNMRVNARGDTIDGKGNVIKTRNQTVNDNYNRTVGTAMPVESSYAKMAPIVEDKHPTEQEFDEQDDIEIEKIKQQETTKKGKK